MNTAQDTLTSTGMANRTVVNGWNDNITPAYSNYSIYLNTYFTSSAIGWSATTSSSSIPTFAINNGNGVITGGILGELNGDGLPDYSTCCQDVTAHPLAGIVRSG